jgi:transglutaminase-like putative cysteine protease
MVFHMWTEARLNGRWLPLDATEGTVAEIDRIKFFSSPMLGVNPYRAILPVLENMDQLQISFKSQD